MTDIPATPTTASSELSDDGAGSAETLPPAKRPSVFKIVLRVVVVVVALGISAVVLMNVFDDLDPAEIRSALGALDDAEVLSLLSMWLLWLAAQGLLTASLIQGLPVRRGVLAYLGPAAVTSVVPGPSDLPVRHRMLTSWGRSSQEATLAVAAGGLFSIGIKLLLPIVAGLGLLISDAPLDGPLRTAVYITVVVAIVVAVIAFVFSSPTRTERVGRLIAPVWRGVLRLLRRSGGREHTNDALADRLVEVRTRSLETLEGRWKTAAWATLLTAATRFALLLMSVRFVDVAEGDLPWTQVFVVFALVQGLTVFPITPGDAGVSEVAFIGLLTAAAGSQYVNEVTAAVVIFRVLTWLVIIPVGLATLGFWRYSLRRTARQTQVQQVPT